MKLLTNIAAVAALILLTVPAFAQRVPIGRSEPTGQTTIKVDKDNIKANAEQPNFNWTGQTVEIRVSSAGSGGYPASSRLGRRAAREQQPLFSSAVAKVLTALGARPAASVDAIRGESQDRGDLRGNAEVNQETMPPQGSISVAKYILQVEVIQVRNQKDLDIFLRRFKPLGGVTFNFEHSESTVHTVIAAELKDRATLETVAAFAVRGKARHQDNLAVSIFSGLFSSSGGKVRQESTDFGTLELNSAKNGFEQLLGVLQLHDTSVRPRAGN